MFSVMKNRNIMAEKRMALEREVMFKMKENNNECK